MDNRLTKLYPFFNLYFELSLNSSNGFPTGHPVGNEKHDERNEVRCSFRAWDFGDGVSVGWSRFIACTMVELMDYEGS